MQMGREYASRREESRVRAPHLPFVTSLGQPFGSPGQAVLLIATPHAGPYKAVTRLCYNFATDFAALASPFNGCQLPNARTVLPD
jgi:hypothetical protein